MVVMVVESCEVYFYRSKSCIFARGLSKLYSTRNPLVMDISEQPFIICGCYLSVKHISSVSIYPPIITYILSGYPSTLLQFNVSWFAKSGSSFVQATNVSPNFQVHVCLHFPCIAPQSMWSILLVQLKYDSLLLCAYPKLNGCLL